MNKVLEKAIELIEKYEWTKGAYARDAHGDSVDTWSKEACSFCALGFLRRARFELMHYPQLPSTVEKLVEQHVPEDFSGNISAFNDAPKTTKEDIIALFRKANESLHSRV